MAYILTVEISAGTKERLLRKYQEENNNYSPKGIESDDFDIWFNRWLNATLFKGGSKEKGREQEVTEMDNDPGYKK